MRCEIVGRAMSIREMFQVEVGQPGCGAPDGIKDRETPGDVRHFDTDIERHQAHRPLAARITPAAQER
jgi:hypothetical protein